MRIVQVATPAAADPATLVGFGSYACEALYCGEVVAQTGIDGIIEFWRFHHPPEGIFAAVHGMCLPGVSTWWLP